MDTTMRSKIGVVALLWGIIALAALSGWMIGHGSAEMRIAQLKQQLAVSAPAKQTCGMEIELLEARADKPKPATNLFGLTLHGIWPGAPQHLHLREMLSLR
jgi:hypothetical protein